jgi:hypothetical protein
MGMCAIECLPSPLVTAAAAARRAVPRFSALGSNAPACDLSHDRPISRSIVCVFIQSIDLTAEGGARGVAGGQTRLFSKAVAKRRAKK